MSEEILIALITSVGSIVGGIVGNYIVAYATIKSATIKKKGKSSKSPKNKKPLSWVGVFGGVVIGAVLTLAALFIFGLFPTQQNDIDQISGTWLGTAKSGEIEYDVRFEIGESCEIGSICGTFDFPSFSCSGTLSIINIEGNKYEFQAYDRTSGCNVSPDIKDYLQLLPDGTLIYVSSSNDYDHTRGVLRKEE